MRSDFHGATDALLVAGGSGVATLGLPGTAGVPKGAVAEPLGVPYNVVPELDEQVAATVASYRDTQRAGTTSSTASVSTV